MKTSGNEKPETEQRWSCPIFSYLYECIFVLINWYEHFSLNLGAFLIGNAYIASSKVGYVFSMVIWSEFRLRKYRNEGHRERTPL